MIDKRKIKIKDFEDKSFKINLLSDSSAESALTHYIHNHNNGVSGFFKKEATLHVKSLLKYKYPEETITNKRAEEELQYLLFDKYSAIPFPPPKKPKFKFIDLFAGIGGFRLALQNLGGKCVFTSEWVKYSQKTYKANYGEHPFGDITKESTKSFIPNNFDVLCAGFLCQAFSIAGKKSGFEDTRGTLFFDVAEIMKRKQPKAFFLENVKGLFNHKSGKTLATILNVLRNELNYFVPDPEIINAKDFVSQLIFKAA